MKLTITTIIKLLLLLLLLLWSFFLFKPFILIFVWGVFIAVPMYPLHQKFTTAFGQKHKKVMNIAFSLMVFLCLFIPLYFISATIFNDLSILINHIKHESFQIPMPSDKIKAIPLIGSHLYDTWIALSSNTKNFIIEYKTFFANMGHIMIQDVGNFIVSFVVFTLACVIAIVLMLHASKIHRHLESLFNKLLGASEGTKILIMSRDIIRSVVKGTILIAITQATLSFVGFSLIHLPGAGLFTLAVLVFAIIQVPVILVMIPAIALAYSTTDNLTTILFSIYIIAVSFSDNLLKPKLMGKGLTTPMPIILIGSLGGMALHGIIGLFIGPVILAIMHRLYTFWLYETHD